MKQKSFLLHGFINLGISGGISIYFTSFRGVILFGIFSALSLDYNGNLFLLLVLYPLAIPLISCLWGILRGAIHFRQGKRARWCLWLSLIGLVKFILWLLLVLWLGTLD